MICFMIPSKVLDMYNTKASALVERLKYMTSVREVLGSIPVRVDKICFRIFDVCHDYCMNDMSHLK